MLNFTIAISSKSFGFICVLLTVSIRSVLLNFDSSEVDAGRRQKIALANRHKIGKSFVIFQLLYNYQQLVNVMLCYLFILFKKKQWVMLIDIFKQWAIFNLEEKTRGKSRNLCLEIFSLELVYYSPKSFPSR